MNKNIADEYFNNICLRVSEKSRLKREQQFIQHGTTSCLMHSIAVAYFSYKIAIKLKKLDFSDAELIRGALLHDYFLYDWHIPDKSHRLHGFNHPLKALKNANEDFILSERERDIILKHMFPMTLLLPSYKESVLICTVDKLCSLYEIFAQYRNKSIITAYNKVVGI